MQVCVCDGRSFQSTSSLDHNHQKILVAADPCVLSIETIDLHAKKGFTSPFPDVCVLFCFVLFLFFFSYFLDKQIDYINTFLLHKIPRLFPCYFLKVFIAALRIVGQDCFKIS